MHRFDDSSRDDEDDPPSPTSLPPSSPTENSRRADQDPLAHQQPSPSSSPCLSTSSSASSSERDRSGKMNTNNNGHPLMQHHPGSYGSLYMSHPTGNPAGSYASLPFPLPALGASFQLPIPLSKATNVHQPFSNGLVVSTSGTDLMSPYPLTS